MAYKLRGRELLLAEARPKGGLQCPPQVPGVRPLSVVTSHHCCLISCSLITALEGFDESTDAMERDRATLGMRREIKAE